MNIASLNGATRGHQCLGRHLTAKDALTLLVRLDPPVGIDLNGFEIEEMDEEIKSDRHNTIVVHAARSTREAAGPV